MFGISNQKFASILFLLLVIFLALFVGSYTTFFTSYHAASLPHLGKGGIRENMDVNIPGMPVIKVSGKGVPPS